MKRILKPVLTMALVIGVIAGSAEMVSAQVGSTQGGGVFDALNKTLPAYGKDVGNTQAMVVHDMALGWYLVAAVEKNDIVQAEVAADQLLATRHKAGTAVPGWGIGWAWDAFGDGTVNNAQAVYGITTAIAARGLFDLYDVTHEAQYRDAALEALDYYYERSFVYSTNSIGDVGVFWYSNSSYDRTWRVFNVISMLMGQYARAYSYTGNGTWKKVATGCFRYLWSHRKTTGNGLKWDYGYNGSGNGYRGANDGIHSAFIVQGMIDYEKYLPALYDISAAVNYLSLFNPRGEQLWSIAQLIYTLTEADKTARAEQLRDSLLPDYRAGRSNYSNTPKDKSVYVRQMTQLAASLLKLEATTTG